MENCIFCKIASGAAPSHKVYEDEDFVAVLDIHPIHLGHCLIIPKQHCRNLLDMNRPELERIGSVIQKLALAVKKVTGADGINIGWNNESAAGQVVFHSHTHIIPRFDGDGYRHWQGKREPTNEELAAMQEKFNLT